MHCGFYTEAHQTKKTSEKGGKKKKKKKKKRDAETWKAFGGSSLIIDWLIYTDLDQYYSGWSKPRGHNSIALSFFPFFSLRQLLFCSPFLYIFC